MVRVKINGIKKAIIDIERYTKDQEIEIKKAVIKTAHDIENQAKALAPVKEGNLKNSIHTDIKDGGFTATIGTPADYASHVEFGTRPHKITVKDANVLSDGKNFFGKEVNHPGTRAQPFLFPAFESNKDKLKDKIEKIVKDK
jgi:HK97 gp10 family phage protein